MDSIALARARRPALVTLLGTTLLLAVGGWGAVASPEMRQPPESRVVRLADGSSATIHLMRERSELRAACVASTGQFELDAATDRAWSEANQALWDPETLLIAAEQALRQSHAALPGPAPDVCIGLSAPPVSPVLERMRGIGGATMRPDLVVLLVAPTLAPDLPGDLRFTLAHEYHHAVSWRRWRNGLEVLIREGRAHHFAWTLYPDHLHPSARALRPDQVPSAWVTIRGHLDDDPSTFLRSFMFGGPYYGDLVPGWAGYTLGYCLVRDWAERNPGADAATIVRTPAHAFLVESPACRS